MNELNIEWALKELENLIHLTASGASETPGVIGLFPRGSESDIAAQAQVAEQILDRVLPRWRTELPDDPYIAWSRHHEAATRARAQLNRAEEIRQNLGDDAPQISAAKLHPWIWSGARSLWQSGHFVQAVRNAATKLNAETQNRVGRRDVSETDLFKQSFSLDEAKPGKSRLRRMTPEDSDTYRSLQRGAMAFAEGVFVGIRNPLSHEVDQEMPEQVALEHLAALSVLARWVDESTVERAGELS
ncbi:TIGR02391 family protein [Curtobacterium sp. MCBD17_028]|uniref:TIGR02391 family protein n=1 Tax=Curtobacterium sp. MCBD17_028 TaxID=2175670 RepID=UPI000DAACEC2|nr:TIGR02391 family protein [Curtobacterium sp. MCBD17_028]PZE24546.1 restriction endonuclease [Curtobacterium sp. MCBD17_028]